MKKNSNTAPAPRRIFIVEDHAEFRQCLSEIVSDQDDLMVCGQAGDAEHARRAINHLKPDLVLVDLALPGKSGLDLIKEVRTSNRTIKFLVVSMHHEALYAERVLRAGGDGYIMKQEHPDEIVNAMQDLLRGHIYLSEAIISGPMGGARTGRFKKERDGWLKAA